MKKLIVMGMVALTCVSVWAQGQLTFINRDIANGIDAPIFDVDGTTKLAGSAYLADLYYGPVGSDPSTFTSLGLAIAFRTGAAAGYLPTTVVSVPGVAPGQEALFQIRAWRASDGTTWQAAYNAQGVASPIAAAQNPVVRVTVTGPPNAPAALVGLTSHRLIVVPEPSTILLGLAGLGGLLYLRRRKA
ncbi:PEP-CTERM sorting domain-containing protein [Fontisphaera persica]|uniref:PEP-CTERM sorting domain-containing protein n=1 Tax=Fontisphaera persica TaxID=2974023 RepID=UPI0024C0BDFA|nr:PEP-CTERM sorting domain-containing protein [Fontisphaera persica]WCJ59015.1 PEP-CTERM sorting domain-containing protein [Fontisphaera persica]